MVSHNKDKSFKEVFGNGRNLSLKDFYETFIVSDEEKIDRSWSPDLLKRVVPFPDNEDGWFKETIINFRKHSKRFFLKTWCKLMGYKYIEAKDMSRGKPFGGLRYNTVIFDDMEEENNNVKNRTNNRTLKR